MEQARKVLENHWPQVIPDDLDAEIRKQFEILLPRDEMQPDGFWDRFIAA